MVSPKSRLRAGMPQSVATSNMPATPTVVLTSERPASDAGTFQADLQQVVGDGDRAAHDCRAHCAGRRAPSRERFRDRRWRGTAGIAVQPLIQVEEEAFTFSKGSLIATWPSSAGPMAVQPQPQPQRQYRPRIFALFFLRLLFASLRKPPPVPSELITPQPGMEEGFDLPVHLV